MPRGVGSGGLLGGLEMNINWDINDEMNDFGRWMYCLTTDCNQQSINDIVNDFISEGHSPIDWDGTYARLEGSDFYVADRNHDGSYDTIFQDLGSGNWRYSDSVNSTDDTIIWRIFDSSTVGNFDISSSVQMG